MGTIHPIDTQEHYLESPERLSSARAGNNAGMEKAAITPRLVSRLVAMQFPEWAHLPVAAVELDGHDNTTFRLGDELSVRLPSADSYVPQVDKEHRWLPILAPHLPLPIPEPVARGAPALEFPRPWSVYRWRPGEPAIAERVHNETRFATDLAGFLEALYAIDPTGGPAAGAHSFSRGGPLATLDADARQAIATLAHEMDADAATAAWEAARATEWEHPPVWVHGDITNSNLLVMNGRLSAVLDFGCSAIGDPACDLAIAWTFFIGESRRAFRGALALDEGTWARGRGWALWKALITHAKLVRSDTHMVDDAHRFGWRLSSRRVLDEVLTNA
jgi:aminoglycoside phosphotransferase (APT) family kinase protein